jgi:hypothetical protein
MMPPRFLPVGGAVLLKRVREGLIRAIQALVSSSGDCFPLARFGPSCAARRLRSTLLIQMGDVRGMLNIRKK